MAGAGDLLDKRKVVPWIIREFKVDRQKANELFEKLKQKENQRIPDVQDVINEVLNK